MIEYLMMMMMMMTTMIIMMMRNRLDTHLIPHGRIEPMNPTIDPPAHPTIFTPRQIP
jgi:hypothetical protein